jgi:ComF family protein
MGLLDFVFPKTCLGCDKEGVYICSDCLAKVRLAKPICPRCEKASIDGITHVKCARKYGLDGLISVWEYEGVVRKAILSLKYKYATGIATLLGSLFIGQLGSPDSKFRIPSPVVLVPIPIHWYRQNTRGFNQSVEIGRPVASAMNWKFSSDLLVRKKSTTPQVDLTGDERKQNLKGAFAVSPNVSTSLYPDVLLFDDVFTTGSTLKEAAKALKRAGVQKVWGLTIAR